MTKAKGEVLIILVCWWLLLPGMALSQSREKQTEPVARLDELLRELESNNSEIAMARSRAKAARTRPSQEGTLPDPMIGVMSTSMGNAAPFTTIGEDPQSNAGVSLEQEIPFPGKLSLKRAAATQEAKSLSEQSRAARLNVISRFKGAYYELQYLYRSADVLEETLATLRQLAEVAKIRYNAGGGTQQDVIRAGVDAAILEGRLVSVQQKKNAATAMLNSLLSRPAGTTLGRPEPPLKSKLGRSLAELSALAEGKNPGILAQAAMVKRGRLAADLARREYYPDFVVGAYYGDSGRNPDMFQYRLDMRVPLYFHWKQRRGVEEAALNLSAARKELEMTSQSISSELQNEYLRAQAAEKLVDLYSEKVVRDARLALQSSVSSYQAGLVDFLTMLTNLTTTQDYELAYAEQLMNLQQALARIEELIGGHGEEAGERKESDRK